MRVLLDMDETLVNLVDPWLALLNEEAETDFSRHDTTCYSVEKSFEGKLSMDEVFRPFDTPGFWSGLPPFPGAIEFVQRLYDNDFDIYIATIPALGSVCHYEKEQWVMEHLPFIGRERLVFCHHKFILKGEALFDDNPKYLSSFQGKRLLFDKPWNQDDQLDKEGYNPKWFIRIYDYAGAFNFLMQLELPFDMNSHYAN
jgi:5'(3')-deoxyribonucleotidase